MSADCGYIGTAVWWPHPEWAELVVTYAALKKLLLPFEFLIGAGLGV